MRVRRPDEGRGLFRPPRASLQRGVIILPSAFTLGNLFFGMYAIVASTRGDFIWSAWFIVWAGILDLLDGRVARFTRTGSKFGAELDSLVDAVSFGVAPGRFATERSVSLAEERAAIEGVSVDDHMAATAASVPFGRYGEPAEFGRVGAFVLSPAASYMTGANVQVDGGLVVAIP